MGERPYTKQLVRERLADALDAGEIQFDLAEFLESRGNLLGL